MTAAIPKRHGRPRLLVSLVLRETWRIVFRHRRDLVAGGALPFLLSTCITLFLSQFDPRPSDEGTMLVVGAISGVPLTAYRIGWYRLVLRDERISWRSILRWSPTHSLFVGWSLLESAAYALPGLVGPSWFASLCLPATMYIVARASFVLASAALDEPILVSLMWARSMHNGWRLVLLDMATMFATMLVLIPIIFALGHFVHVPKDLLVRPFAFLIVPLGTTANALAFRALVEFDATEDEEVEPVTRSEPSPQA